jgi:D-sedoheptulose 7-phosphate isomerase
VKAPTKTTRDLVRGHLSESIETKQKLLDMTEPIEAACDLLARQLKAGHKLLIFGNGGSAADAQHIAAEMIGRLESNDVIVPAVALTTDSSMLTAIANDFGFDHVYSRQVQVLAQRGDVVIGISTSGNSKNVVEGVRAAKQAGAHTIGLVGMNGGKMADFCDQLIRVPSTRTMRVQEGHITIGHILCHAVEMAFL